MACKKGGGVIFHFNVTDLVQKHLHRYQTRHAEDYEIPHFKTNFARKTIRATGPIKWNLTEKHVKEAKTIKHFRNKIKKNIIAEYV